MNKSLLAGAIAAIAVFAAVFYFAGDEGGRGPATAESPKRGAASLAGRPGDPAPVASNPDSVASAAGPDRRIEAFQVSADNGLIEFVTDDGGKVIREIDKDPGSPGFGKPSREYTYAGDRVVNHVAYRYLGDQVQIIRTSVSYYPDGSVQHYRETTSYEAAASQ